MSLYKGLLWVVGNNLTCTCATIDFEKVDLSFDLVQPNVRSGLADAWASETLEFKLEFLAVQGSE